MPVEPERLRLLADPEPRAGRYVLYWMQRAQRVAGNHALAQAVARANEARLPLLVCFGLTDGYPEANLRHYRFLLEGLAEVRDDLAKRGIGFVLRRGAPDEVALDLSRDAARVVTDRGYVRVERQWRERLARLIDRPLEQVETDLIVPLEEASGKEEYAAATFRPKITRLLDRYLRPLRLPAVTQPWRRNVAGDFEGVDLDSVLGALRIDRSVAPVPGFRGGRTEALKRLRAFLKHRLGHYAEDRNDPANDYQSSLSAYLHFGQIAPLEVALAVQEAGGAGGAGGAGADAFLEQLIVRRELAFNFVYYNDRYDAYGAIPAWAAETLARHAADPRLVVYTEGEFDQARTHDPYWNAAQLEMTLDGNMHGYMRMYWAKKILEWTETPEQAFALALSLNNRYEMDGRDPNGFAGVAWTFGKHDRPWTERPIFGTVRYMNAAGLRRKFAIETYVDRIESRCRDAGVPGPRERAGESPRLF